jgi:peptidoglycan/xylan/chitin deacetylase (PgdA/CDA1 family)
LPLVRFLVVMCVFLFAVPGAPKAEADLHNLSFGSERVLKQCWSEEALQGRPEDKIIVRTTDLLPQPPKITAPLGALCPDKLAQPNSIRRVIPARNEKVVALTFDLCERADEIAGYDYEIVNYLRSHRVRATFFAGGKWMQFHQEKAMQIMVDPLFEVGNHSWTHANLRLVGGKKMLEQILLPQAQYRELRKKLVSWPCASRAGMREIAKIPMIPVVFRFPFGTCSDEALETLGQLHLPAVQWDVVTADSEKRQSATAIAKAILENVQPGSIILCHANGRGYHTARALDLFVPELRKRGYTFVTVSHLLTLGPVFSTPECYELTPGDNKKYDELFGEGTVLRKQ